MQVREPTNLSNSFCNLLASCQNSQSDFLMSYFIDHLCPTFGHALLWIRPILGCIPHKFTIAGNYLLDWMFLGHLVAY